jgi:NADPH:quinone reductase-like Zn-dependent oxidoreductase
MKAIRIHAHGGPERLRIDDLEPPKIGPRQVLVKVRAAALNQLDLWVRKGIPGVPLPVIMGADASGVVQEVGGEVTRFEIGERVLAHPGRGCGLCLHCKEGREHYCASYGIAGEHFDGYQAQLVALDEGMVLPMPSDLGFEEGAAIPLVYLTAWEMLVNKAQVKPGDTVLVMGGSSGVGSAAVQIARLFGARVITTVGTSKLVKANALGAAVVLDHYKQSIAKEVRALTAGRGADIIVDHVGSATWQVVLRSLANGGQLILCGATTGPDVTMDLRFLFLRQQKIWGSTMGGRGDLLRVLRHVECGKLRGVVDRVFPFTEIAAAHEHLESGRQFGKVVLSFAE